MKEYSTKLKNLTKGRWYKLKFNPFEETISGGLRISGNYVFFIGKKLQYIGESTNLIKRINRHISLMWNYFPDRKPRIIFKIRPEKKEERKEIERKLIMKLKPLGNSRHNHDEDFTGQAHQWECEKIDLEEIITINENLKYFERFLATRKLIKTKLNDKHNLNNKEMEILKMRFGLESDKKKCTLQKIGIKFNISRERVRQIEVNAIGKLISQGRCYV